MVRFLYVAVDGWHFRNHQLPVALAARDAGYEVVVAAAPDRFVSEIEAAGLPFHPLSLRKSRSPRQAWIALSAMTRLLRELRPDLVQLGSLRVAALGGLAVRRTGTPAMVRVLTGRGYVFTEGSWPLRAAVQGLWKMGRAPKSWTVFQNRDDLELFAGRGLAADSASSVVAGSGVDLAAFRARPEPPGPPSLLYLGRMLRSKGVPELVEASKLLRSRGSDHRLLLAGEPDPGNPSTLLEEELRAWQAAGHAEWLGHRRDVPELLTGCAVLALPTTYGEGLPRVLLEAAACGRPVVATRSPGCTGAVRDGETGLLVPPGDVPALAGALEKLLADPGLRREMGARARARAEAEFGIEGVAEKFLEIYARLVRQPPEGAAESQGLSSTTH